ncbi:gephyrin-like molybdotransferase Glp [Thiomicrorhabdus sp. Milos-T2]|uniref:molybdopterin molybdotransferase MoeA n=1 Tax=Thiomicrorhabdus sp. Milos-T2 TaxID=90814 RepID=UPI000493D116|nr:gephyrin-like molybdotransferase Glp [Thiomicrorhabdus sp. Milos-T2]
MKSFEDAQDFLLEQACETKLVEVRSLDKALNGVLAEDICSKINVPAIDNSMMDGYAVNFSEIQLGKFYSISQVIAAGDIGNSLEPGTVARIFTGAAMPEGADTVIMQEMAEKEFDASEQVKFTTKPEKGGSNVRQVGEDIAVNNVVLEKGKRIQPQDIGILSAIGVSHIEVFKPLRVAIFTTGDELLEPYEMPSPGKIYNTNRYMLKALLQQYGFEVIDLGKINDSLEAIQTILKAASEMADIIITTGGVSVGEKDFIKPAVESLGFLKMWKVNMKPGKPLAFGEVLGTPFIGLPGNPVASFSTYYLFARPFLLKMQGCRSLNTTSKCITAGFDWTRMNSRREFIRVKIERQDNCMFAIPYRNQGAGIISSIVNSDGFAVIPENTTIQKGDLISYFSFNDFK